MFDSDAQRCVAVDESLRVGPSVGQSRHHQAVDSPYSHLERGVVMFRVAGFEVCTGIQQDAGDGQVAATDHQLTAQKRSIELRIRS